LKTVAIALFCINGVYISQVDQLPTAMIDKLHVQAMENAIARRMPSHL